MGKPILCLDFDGVIHGYDSGWKGAGVIPDPPVPGALEFIVESMKHFEVHIFSSRSHQRGGIKGMKKWLSGNFWGLCLPTFDDTPSFMQKRFEYSGTDLYDEDIEYAVKKLIKEIKFPKHKPPSMVSIDDRGLTFDGTFPDPEALLDFKPWNKQ